MAFLIWYHYIVQQLQTGLYFQNDHVNSYGCGHIRTERLRAEQVWGRIRTEREMRFGTSEQTLSQDKLECGPSEHSLFMDNKLGWACIRTETLP